jgi:hypothetical protein
MAGVPRLRVVYDVAASGGAGQQRMGSTPGQPVSQHDTLNGGMASAVGGLATSCWSISGRPLLAAADTAGAEITDQFRVVMSLETMIIACAPA